jgi:hypothetical protein
LQLVSEVQLKMDPALQLSHAPWLRQEEWFVFIFPFMLSEPWQVAKWLASPCAEIRFL